jgi:hypothetical protein
MSREVETEQEIRLELYRALTVERQRAPTSEQPQRMAPHLFE